jgi:hypothetical protein
MDNVGTGSINSKRPNGNRYVRQRRQCIRAYRLHDDGMTVANIAELLGKRPEQVSEMIKIGERFADSE